MEKVRFDNFIKLNRGFDLPDSLIEDGEYPVIASTSIKGYHKEYKVEGPMVTTGRSGSLGKVVYTEGKCWPLNTTLYVKDFKDNNPRYVYYYLQLMHLEQYNAGAGVPTLNQNHLHSLKIQIHGKELQRKIASILSTYDNLIENNTKRIKLLEQMAENLYKEWFVRFRFPGHENMEMENGLPKGWKIERYGEIADITAGGDCPNVCSDTPTDNINIPIYSNGIANNGLYGYTNKAKIEMPCITISARGTVGFVCLHREPFVPIVRLLAVVPKELSVYYLFHSSKYNDLEGNGTSQQQLTKPMLVKRKILIPTKDIVDRFDDFTSKLYTQIDNIQKQNSYLTRQRDLLLPRLMSGKLEVKV